MLYNEVLEAFDNLPKIEEHPDDGKHLRWQYYIANWQQYDLVDTKEQFIKLLNILEVNGENLDSLHDVCFNGREEFCSIYGRWENDREVAETLFDFHFIFENKKQFIEYVNDKVDEYESADDYVQGCDIRPCFNYIIERLWY